MCSPAGGAAMGLDIIGGAEGYEAAQSEAKSTKSYYDFLAGQNDALAKTSLERGEETATSIATTSAIDESNLDRSAKRTEGAQRAALGANGVSSGSVTAEDIARDTSRTHELDVTALRYDADSKIWATRTAAADKAKALTSQANSFRMAGNNAIKAGDIKANSSLIGSATSVADNWYRWSQTGAGRSAPAVQTAGRSGGYAQAPDYGNA